MRLVLRFTVGPSADHEGLFSGCLLLNLSRLFDHVSIGSWNRHRLTGSSLVFGGERLLLLGLLANLYLQLELAQLDALVDVLFAKSLLVFVDLGQSCDKVANDEYKAKESPVLVSVAIVDKSSFK